MGCALGVQYHLSSYRMAGQNRPLLAGRSGRVHASGNTIEERAEAYRTYMSSGLDRSEETMIDTAVRRLRLTGSVSSSRKYIGSMACWASTGARAGRASTARARSAERLTK